MPPSPGMIGDFLRRAPNSENRPEVEQITRHPAVKTEIERVWAASNPNAPGDARQERGFRIRQNSDGDIWTIPESRQGKPGEPWMKPDEPTMFNEVYDWLTGEKTIAHVHTHPFASGTLKQSPDDEAFARDKAHAPGIIKSREGMYYYGPALPGQPDAPFWKFWK